MAEQVLAWGLTAALQLTLALAVVALLRPGLRWLAGVHGVLGLWALVPVWMSAPLVLPFMARMGSSVASALGWPFAALNDSGAALGHWAAVSVAVAAAPGHWTVALPRPLVLSLLFAWMVGTLAVCAVQVLRHRRWAAQGDAAGPACVGVLRPRVVLPTDFAQRFTADEQPLILAHERIHARRHDNAAMALATAVQALFWWLPHVHWASARLQRDQELACDARVLDGADARRIHTYRQALLRAQGLGPASIPPPAMATSWQALHPLVERIAMLNQPSVSVLRRRLGALSCVGFALTATWVARAVEAPAASAAAATTGAPLTGDEVSLTTSIEWNGEMLREDTQRTRLGATQVWRLKRKGGPGADLDLSFEFTVKRPGPDHPAGKAGKLPADAVWISSTLTVGEGDDRSVSHPSLITANGQKATIEMGMTRADGRPERRVRITVLPRLAAPDSPSRGAPEASEKGSKSAG